MCSHRNAGDTRSMRGSEVPGCSRVGLGCECGVAWSVRDEYPAQPWLGLLCVPNEAAFQQNGGEASTSLQRKAGGGGAPRTPHFTTDGQTWLSAV